MVPALALDSFAVLVIVGIVGGVGALMLIGIVTPGTGAEQLDWRPTRSPELEAQNEVDDVAQMLAATNARRRRKGLEDLTEDELTLRVARDQREQRERRDRYVADGAGGAATDGPSGADDAGRPESQDEIDADAAELEALVRRKREARLAREAERRRLAGEGSGDGSPGSAT